LGYNVPQKLFFCKFYFVVDLWHNVAQIPPQIMKLSEVLKVRLPQETLSQLAHRAKAEGLPMSILARRALADFLAQRVPHYAHITATKTQLNKSKK
jgi:hypothetical protein